MRLRAATGSRRPRNPTRQGSGTSWDRRAKAQGTPGSGRPGARPGSAKGVARASWPVGGSHLELSLPPTSRPVLRQSPNARGATAVTPPCPPTPRPLPLLPSPLVAAHLPRAAASGLVRAAQAGHRRLSIASANRAPRRDRRRERRKRPSIPGASAEAPDQWEGGFPAAARKGRGKGWDVWRQWAGRARWDRRGHA